MQHLIDRMYQLCLAIEKIDGSPEQTAASDMASALYREMQRPGWRVVPVEPTEEMIIEGALTVHLGNAPIGTWRAMVEKAPSLFCG